MNNWFGKRNLSLTLGLEGEFVFDLWFRKGSLSLNQERKDFKMTRILFNCLIFATELVLLKALSNPFITQYITQSKPLQKGFDMGVIWEWLINEQMMNYSAALFLLLF